MSNPNLKLNIKIGFVMKMTLQTTLPPNPPPVVADKLLFTPPNPKINSYKNKNNDMKNNYNLKVIGC